MLNETRMQKAKKCIFYFIKYLWYVRNIIESLAIPFKNSGLTFISFNLHQKHSCRSKTKWTLWVFHGFSPYWADTSRCEQKFAKVESNAHQIEKKYLQPAIRRFDKQERFLKLFFLVVFWDLFSELIHLFRCCSKCPKQLFSLPINFQNS